MLSLPLAMECDFDLVRLLAICTQVVLTLVYIVELRYFVEWATSHIVGGSYLLLAPRVILKAEMIVPFEADTRNGFCTVSWLHISLIPKLVGVLTQIEYFLLSQDVLFGPLLHIVDRFSILESFQDHLVLLCNFQKFTLADLFVQRSLLDWG